MRIEDTAGNVTYTFSNCDCGLTGGCEKCQPLYIPKHSVVEYKPSPRFDPAKFYEPIATIPIIEEF